MSVHIYENVVLQDVDITLHEVTWVTNNCIKGEVSLRCKIFLYHDMTTIGNNNN